MKFLGPATPEEVAAAFNTDAGTTYERVNDEQKEYACKRCERVFFVSPNAWIFYGLCDPCFADADREKWERRIAVADAMERPTSGDIRDGST